MNRMFQCVAGVAVMFAADALRAQSAAELSSHLGSAASVTAAVNSVFGAAKIAAKGTGPGTKSPFPDGTPFAIREVASGNANAAATLTTYMLTSLGFSIPTATGLVNALKLLGAIPTNASAAAAAKAYDAVIASASRADLIALGVYASKKEPPRAELRAMAAGGSRRDAIGSGRLGGTNPERRGRSARPAEVTKRVPVP